MVCVGKQLTRSLPRLAPPPHRIVRPRPHELILAYVRRIPMRLRHRDVDVGLYAGQGQVSLQRQTTSQRGCEEGWEGRGRGRRGRRGREENGRRREMGHGRSGIEEFCVGDDGWRESVGAARSRWYVFPFVPSL